MSHDVSPPSVVLELAGGCRGPRIRPGRVGPITGAARSGARTATARL